MKTYRLRMVQSNPDFPQSGPPSTFVELGTRQGKNAIETLEAFVTEKGVAEHYGRHGSRKRLTGLGVPTLEADLVK